MTPKPETGTSALDIIKLVLAVLLVVSGVGGFYYLAEESLLYRVLGLVAIAVVALVLVFTTQIGHKLAVFFKDSRTEVRKVVWPSRQETTQTTILVVVMVFVVGVFLWLLDMFLFWGVRVLTGQGG